MTVVLKSLTYPVSGFFITQKFVSKSSFVHNSGVQKSGDIQIGFYLNFSAPTPPTTEQLAAVQAAYGAVPGGQYQVVCVPNPNGGFTQVQISGGPQSHPALNSNPCAPQKEGINMNAFRKLNVIWQRSEKSILNK